MTATAQPAAIPPRTPTAPAPRRSRRLSAGAAALLLAAILGEHGCGHADAPATADSAGSAAAGTDVAAAAAAAEPVSGSAAGSGPYGVEHEHEAIARAKQAARTALGDALNLTRPQATFTSIVMGSGAPLPAAAADAAATAPADLTPGWLITFNIAPQDGGDGVVLPLAVVTQQVGQSTVVSVSAPRPVDAEDQDHAGDASAPAGDPQPATPTDPAVAAQGQAGGGPQVPAVGGSDGSLAVFVAADGRTQVLGRSR